MEFTSLGSLSPPASVIGLGTGGASRLGQGYGQSEAHSIALVAAALRMGINLIDTAQGYGTETIVGRALRETASEIPRNRLIVCSKAPCHKDMEPLPWSAFQASVYGSLERLGLDCLDLYYIHALYMEHVDHALDSILPGLQELKREGVIRAVGISEHFNSDPSHRVLLRVLRAAPGCADVLMVGFNILNPSARRELLPLCRQQGIGTTCMFAVRHAFSQPTVLQRIVGDLIARGIVARDRVDADAPLGFLVREGHAESVTEAAYRFCRYEPGIDVVLSGTGRRAHLDRNAHFLLQPPLKPAARERLQSLFGHVDSVTGQDKPYAKQ